MKILIIGSGMYVTGKNNTGTGTILSSLIQSTKSLPLTEIIVVSKSNSSEASVQEAAKRINDLLSTAVKVSFQAIENDPENKLAEIHKAEEFAACIICVPDHLHFKFGKITLELGIPTLMVKPLTPTLAEAKELIEIADKNNTYTSVEFHKRFDETNRWIKKAIQEKQIGKLNYFNVNYSQRIHIPLETFKSWSGASNIFQYLGVHYVDLIYYLTRFTPIRTMAYGVNGILKHQEIDTFDSVHVLVEWQNPLDPKDQFIASYNTNWVDPNNSSALSDQKYQVVGTKGRIECDQKNRGIELVTEETGIQQINPYFSDYLVNENNELYFDGYGHKSIHMFMNDVVELKNGETTLETLNKNRPTFTESLVSVAVTEAVNKSLASAETWINIEL